MITIIHGGHRDGLCYNAARALCDSLESKNEVVRLYNLRNNQFDFCCGDQPCQEDAGTCIYSDALTNEVLPTLAKSKSLIVFTPTYFNAPPAMLKNFMDRCNFLLTMENRNRLHFGAWIAGQTDEDSLKQCYQSLVTFAEICEYEFLENGCVLRVEEDVHQTKITDSDLLAIEKIAKEIISLG